MQNENNELNYDIDYYEFIKIVESALIKKNLANKYFEDSNYIYSIIEYSKSLKYLEQAFNYNQLSKISNINEIKIECLLNIQKAYFNIKKNTNVNVNDCKVN